MQKITLSNSAVETAESCPTKYYWRYEREQVPVDDGEAAPLKFGIAIHSALEERGKGGSLDEVIRVFDKEFPKDLTNKHTQSAGRLMLKDYFNRYQDDELVVIGNEKQFEIDLGSCMYRGRIDKLVQGESGISVMDHKTTSYLGSTFYNMSKPNGQFTGYIYAADCEYGEVGTLIVDGLLVPYPYKSKPLVTDFQRVVTSRTPKELEMWAENIRGIVCNINKWRKSKLFPKYDKGYNCSSRWGECAYRNLCLMALNPQDIVPPSGLYKRKEE